MSGAVLAIIMLASFILFIALGFPIAFTLMALGITFGYQAFYVPGQEFWDNRIFYLFTQNTFSVMNNDVLISIPLFLFMGYVIERANILDKLFLSLQVGLRFLPGSMAVAALVTCTLFATATGIVGAVVTLMGLIALPSMLKAGYDQKLATGTIAAGGTLGILIPPSILLIVYAATASVSVVRLYAAALIPGILLATLYMAYVIGRAMINPSLCPKPKDVENYSVLDSALMVLKAFVPLAALILAVLGSILFGLATPSEAAAMGALGSLVLAAVYRALTWQGLRESVYLTARTSAMVCFLFVGSATFASIFSYQGGEALVKDFLVGLDLTPLQFLILAQVIIFVLGWPLEWTEIIIIFVPIFLPLLPVYGIDPILFGILIAINLQTAFLTPPMAMSAVYLKGVAPKNVQLGTIFKGCMPFVYMVIMTLVLTYTFPQMATYLPEVLFDNQAEVEFDASDDSVVNPEIFKDMK